MPVSRRQFLNAIRRARLDVSNPSLSPEFQELARTADRVLSDYSWGSRSERKVNNGKIDREEEWAYIFSRLESAENDNDVELNSQTSIQVLRSLQAELGVGRRWNLAGTGSTGITRIGATGDATEPRMRRSLFALRRLYDKRRGNPHRYNDTANLELIAAYQRVMSELVAMNTAEREAFLASLSEDDRSFLIAISSDPPPWNDDSEPDEFGLMPSGETVFHVLFAGIEDGELAARTLLAWRDHARRGHPDANANSVAAVGLARQFLDGEASAEQRVRFIETLAEGASESFFGYRSRLGDFQTEHQKSADPASAAIAMALVTLENEPRHLNQAIAQLQTEGKLEAVVHAATHFGYFQQWNQELVTSSSLESSDGRNDLFFATELLRIVQSSGNQRSQRAVLAAFETAAQYAGDTAHGGQLTPFPPQILSRLRSGAYSSARGRRRLADADLDTMVARINGGTPEQQEIAAAQLYFTLARLADSGELSAFVVANASNAAKLRAIHFVLGKAPPSSTVTSKLFAQMTREQTRGFIDSIAQAAKDGTVPAEVLHLIVDTALEHGRLNDQDKRNLVIDYMADALRKQGKLSPEDERRLAGQTTPRISITSRFDAHAFVVARVLASLQSNESLFIETFHEVSRIKLNMDATEVMTLDELVAIGGTPLEQPTMLFVVARSATMQVQAEGVPSVLAPRSRYGLQRDSRTVNFEPLNELVAATASAGTSYQRALMLSDGVRGGLIESASWRGTRAWDTGMNPQVAKAVDAFVTMLETTTQLSGETVDLESTFDMLLRVDPSAIGLTWLFVYGMGENEWRKLSSSTYTGETEQEALEEAAWALGMTVEEMRATRPPPYLEPRQNPQTGLWEVVLRDGEPDPHTSPPNMPDPFVGRFYNIYNRLVGGSTLEQRQRHFFYGEDGRANTTDDFRNRQRLGYFEGARYGSVQILAKSIHSDKRFTVNDIVTRMNLQREWLSVIGFANDVLGASRSGAAVAGRIFLKVTETVLKVQMHAELGRLRDQQLRAEERSISSLYDYAFFLLNQWTIYKEDRMVPAQLHYDRNSIYKDFDRVHRRAVETGRNWRADGTGDGYMNDPDEPGPDAPSRLSRPEFSSTMQTAQVTLSDLLQVWNEVREGHANAEQRLTIFRRYISLMSTVGEMSTEEKETFLRGLSDEELNRLIDISTHGRTTKSGSPAPSGETIFHVLLGGITDGELASRVILAWDARLQWARGRDDDFPGPEGADRAQIPDIQTSGLTLGMAFLGGEANAEQRQRFIEGLKPGIRPYSAIRTSSRHGGIRMRTSNLPAVLAAAALISLADAGGSNLDDSIQALAEAPSTQANRTLLHDVVYAAAAWGLVELQSRQVRGVSSSESDPHILMRLLQVVEESGSADSKRLLRDAIAGQPELEYTPANVDSRFHRSSLSGLFPTDLVARLDDRNGPYRASRIVSTAESDLATVERASTPQQRRVAAARLVFTLSRMTDAQLQDFFRTVRGTAETPQPRVETLYQAVSGAPGGVDLLTRMISGSFSGVGLQRVILELAENTKAENGNIRPEHFSQIVDKILAAEVLSSREKYQLIRRASDRLEVQAEFDPYGLLAAKALVSLNDDPREFQRALDYLIRQKLDWEMESRLSSAQLEALRRGESGPEPEMMPSLLWVIARHATLAQRRSQQGQNVIGAVGPLLRSADTVINDGSTLLELVNSTTRLGSAWHRAHVLAATTQGGMRQGYLAPRGLHDWKLGLIPQVQALKDALIEMLEFDDRTPTGDDISPETTFLGLQEWDPRGVGMTWLFVAAMGPRQWVELGSSYYDGRTLEEAIRRAAEALGMPAEDIQYEVVEQGPGRVRILVLDGMHDPFTSPEGMPDGYVGDFEKLYLRLTHGEGARRRNQRQMIRYWWEGPNGNFRDGDDIDVRKRIGYFEGARFGSLLILERSVRSDLAYERIAELTMLNVEREMIGLISFGADWANSLFQPNARGQQPWGRTTAVKMAARAAELTFKLRYHRIVGRMRDNYIRRDERNASELMRYATRSILFSRRPFQYPLVGAEYTVESGERAAADLNRVRRRATSAGVNYRPDGSTRSYLWMLDPDEATR